MTDSAPATPLRLSWGGIALRIIIAAALLGFGFWFGRRGSPSHQSESAAAIAPHHPAASSAPQSTSAMSPSARTSQHADEKTVPLAFREKLTPLYRTYLHLQAALAKDDAPGAKQAAEAFFKVLNTLGYTELNQPQIHLWRSTTAPLREAAGSLVSRVDLHEQRVLFAEISTGLEATTRAFGIIPGVTIRRFKCAMAFSGKGASWLQAEAVAANPFFGAKRLKCGEQTELLSGR